MPRWDVPAPPPRVAHARARVAALARLRPADDPDLTAARALLAGEQFIARIDRALNAAPPLTGEQRQLLAAALDRPDLTKEEEPVMAGRSVA